MNGRIRWPGSAPETVAALIVLVCGLAETVLTAVGSLEHAALFVVSLSTAVAVGLCRLAPGAALCVLWLLGLVHAGVGAEILLVEFALTAVLFGTARWGRPATAVLGAASVPLIVVAAAALHQLNDLNPAALSRLAAFAIFSRGPNVTLAVALVGLLLVVVPWPAGLAMRLWAQAGASRASMLAAEAAAAGARRETEQAREIAQLRDAQTRLARDVHDVVGHSLAVILAQAESAQYVQDTEKVKRTMETIATSARASLQDVRQVLSNTPEPSTRPDNTRGLDTLIEGVRRSGHEVVDTELGTPRPLPPEIDVVAYRVLQEMLTNAIKHGRRDRPIMAERHWPTSGSVGGFADTLRLEVSNMTQGPQMHAPDAPATPVTAGTDAGGHGLDGMRRRLESIGGHLDVRRRERPAGTTFTATAWLPVRGASGE